ncbi:hypothetical protein PMAA_083230 [Talaromyces marneffei ATCC 18224]|uniref:MobA-like NTP transferase domain-containing protein n=1 Tax=Talaromyces marneffei (strain ATCC 18224 / CBS 334.59 / QM 7333) TaxID=441960 RepID=B6QFT3_TALMQ|nr:hypothetical protein PMAA_083230 [Talaromyces marneffei ATCC 18224]
MTLQALILAGGQSSRMGSRKELLRHPSGLPMYQYLIEIIDIGPAAGLLAAYHNNPETNWLIVACDFPLLSAATLTRLISAAKSSSVTCYRNSKGFCEPLLALWSPEALEKLADNTRQGRTGPRFVVEELPDSRILSPESEVELFNVNTVEEWEEACNLFRSMA